MLFRQLPVLLIFTSMLSGVVAHASVDVVLMDPLITDETRLHVDSELALAGPAMDARTWTRLDEEMLKTFSIESIGDLTWFVPGATHSSVFGIVGVPILRGDLGDVFQNGQRRGFNRNMYPPSFNHVEAIEAITGAPPAGYGYATGTGGLVNFSTKRPNFDHAETTLELTHGSWNEWRWEVDATAPLGENLAGRMSLEGVESDSFYRGVETTSWDAFVALAWKPGGCGRWDFTAEVYDAVFNENPGTNRPTQALIDRGEYITGSSVSSQGGGTGSYFGNTFTPTGTVIIDGSQVLISPEDEATARVYTAQLIGSHETPGGTRIVSRTYWENGRAEKHSSYAFYSGVPRTRTLEQRLEISREWEFGRVRHDVLGGLAMRGEERLSYVDFFNEALNAFDLTLDPSTYKLPANQFFAVLPVPGRPDYFAIPGARYPRPGGGTTTGISQTLHSRLLNGAVFFQDRISWSENVSLLLATRWDIVNVESEDPLPRAGFTPISDEITKVLPASLTASLRWKLNSGLATYLTLNRAAAVDGSSSSGGFGLSNNELAEVIFENRSDLMEVGVKFSNAEGSLEGSAAYYRQHRVRTNPRFAIPDEIFVRGVELAGSYRPTSWLSLSGNYFYMAANYVDGPLPFSIATAHPFDPAVPSDTFGSYPQGDYRVPGLPRWQGNLHAVATLPSGLNLRAWGGVQGDKNVDLFGHVVIPSQFTINLGASYRRDNWEISADCLNITDEFNWRTTESPFAGGDLVLRELPRHWRLKLAYRF